MGPTAVHSGTTPSCLPRRRSRAQVAASSCALRGGRTQHRSIVAVVWPCKEQVCCACALRPPNRPTGAPADVVHDCFQERLQREQRERILQLICNFVRAQQQHLRASGARRGRCRCNETQQHASGAVGEEVPSAVQASPHWRPQQLALAAMKRLGTSLWNAMPALQGWSSPCVSAPLKGSSSCGRAWGTGGAVGDHGQAAHGAQPSMVQVARGWQRALPLRRQAVGAPSR